MEVLGEPMELGQQVAHPAMMLWVPPNMNGRLIVKPHWCGVEVIQ